MDISEWWPRLDPSARGWLHANAYAAIPPDFFELITDAAGTNSPSITWAGRQGTRGFYLTDVAAQWIESQ